MDNSWGSSPSIEISDSEDTGASGVVNDEHQLIYCDFLVKGGNTNDKGAKFNMPFDNRFTMVYVEYAKRVGVRPMDLSLFHRNQYVDPEDSPFWKGFTNNDVVLAYGQDCATPIPYNPNAIESSDVNTCFTIQDLRTVPTVHRYNIKKTSLMRNLRGHWAGKHRVDGSRVTLYLDGKDITGHTTIEEAAVYDGAVLYDIFNDA